MNRPARIKAREKFSPFALRVIQTSKGVFWEKEDTSTGKRTLVLSSSPQSARRLAQWILDNIHEND